MCGKYARKLSARVPGRTNNRNIHQTNQPHLHPKKYCGFSGVDPHKIIFIIIQKNV
jgi:hypothetical protein